MLGKERTPPEQAVCFVAEREVCAPNAGNPKRNNFVLR